LTHTDFRVGVDTELESTCYIASLAGMLQQCHMMCSQFIT